MLWAKFQNDLSTEISRDLRLWCFRMDILYYNLLCYNYGHLPREPEPNMIQIFEIYIRDWVSSQGDHQK